MSQHIMSGPDSSPLVAWADNEHIRRLLRLVQRTLAVESVALSLGDMTQQRVVARVGTNDVTDEAIASWSTRVVRQRERILAPAPEEKVPRGMPGFRLYAGVRIELAEARQGGALCVFGPAPRTLTADERATLADFAALAAEMQPAPAPVITSISENIAEGIFRTEPGEGLTYANQAFATMFGYEDPTPLLHRPAHTFYADPAEREAIIAQIEKAGAASGIEARFRRRDGSTFWGLVSGRATRNAAGRVQYRDGAIIDITERKAMEMRLRESEERWQRLVENHPCAVFISVDGIYRYANPAAARLLGFDAPEDLIGRALLPFVPTEIHDTMRERMHRLRQGERTVPIEHEIIRAEGTRRMVETRSVPVLYQNEAAVQTVSFDVTERRDADRALRESEERWRRLVEHHPEPILISVDGAFRYVNQSGLALFGAASAEDLDGRTVFEFVDEEAAAELRKRKARIEQGERLEPFEHTLIRLDGKTRRIQSFSVPITHKGEAAAQTVLRDVTEQRRTEEALRAAEAKFRGLVEQSLVGIYVIQGGQIVYANPALADIFGYTQEELTGVEVASLVYDEDMHIVRRNIERRLQGAVQDMRYTFRGVRKGGDVIVVEVHGTRTEHAGRPAIIGTLIDVTAQRRWEEELLAAKEEAEEMNRLKSAFLANMSHEIRTPLTSIIGFADLLGSSPEDAGEFAPLIQRSGQRLLWTLNSVLDLAQLEAGAVEVHPVDVDVRDEVQAVLDQFRPQAQAKALTLRLDAPEAPVVINVDRASLARVLTNLVSNAVKFTAEGSVTVEVTPEEQAVVLRVIDTGIGIGDDFLRQIFDEFRQESSGSGRTHEGSGLGLTITRHLVELMDGTIAVDSTPGEGSTFTVRFPRSGKE